MLWSNDFIADTQMCSENSLSSKAVMGDLNNILSRSQKRPSEKEALLNFEESQKELEASISKAVQLVSQKLNPEECISRCEVGLCSEPAEFEYFWGLCDL